MIRMISKLTDEKSSLPDSILKKEYKKESDDKTTALKHRKKRKAKGGYQYLAISFMLGVANLTLTVFWISPDVSVTQGQGLTSLAASDGKFFLISREHPPLCVDNRQT